eukprot:824013_1
MGYTSTNDACLLSVASQSSKSHTTVKSARLRKPLVRRTANGPVCVRFVSPEVCAMQADKRPPRQATVSIPQSFSCLDEYKRIFSRALYFEINYILDETAAKFAKIFLEITDPMILSSKASLKLEHEKQSRPTCPKHGICGPPITVRKSGPNNGRLFYSCPAKKQGCFFMWEDQFVRKHDHSKSIGSGRHSKYIASPEIRQRKFRSGGVSFYSSCTLTKSGGTFWPKRKKRKKISEDFDEDTSTSYGPVERPVKYWLKIESGFETRSVYAKDDLWVISLDGSFSKSWMMRSLYHAPASNTGVMQMGKVDGCSIPPLQREQSICAIRACNACSEVAMLANIHALDLTNTPVLRQLVWTGKVGKLKSVLDGRGRNLLHPTSRGGSDSKSVSDSETQLLFEMVG